MAFRLALDITDPQVLTLGARELPFPGGILDRWLPPQTRFDHRYRFFRKDRAFRRAAPVRPWDSPAVPVERGSAEEVTGRMLPISIILPLLEEEAQLLDAARQANDNEAALDVFANDTRELVRRIRQRVMLMQGEAISSGKVTIGTEAAPENSLQLGSVDFGLPTAHYFTAGTLWSDTANADLLQQLVAMVQQYITTTGNEVRPGVMVASTTIFNDMAQNTKLRNVFGSLLGAPGSVSLDQVNAALASRRLPRLIIDDTAVMNHLGVMQRQIPEDRIVLLPEEPGVDGGQPVGRTQWGTTEEAKKITRARKLNVANMPGLVVVPMESENPVQTATLGTAIAMPVITEPDLIMSVKVR